MKLELIFDDDADYVLYVRTAESISKQVSSLFWANYYKDAFKIYKYRRNIKRLHKLLSRIILRAIQD